MIVVQFLLYIFPSKLYFLLNIDHYAVRADITDIMKYQILHVPLPDLVELLN